LIAFLGCVCFLIMATMVPSFKRGGLYGGLLPIMFLITAGLTVTVMIQQ